MKIELLNKKIRLLNSQMKSRITDTLEWSIPGIGNPWERLHWEEGEPKPVFDVSDLEIDLSNMLNMGMPIAQVALSLGIKTDKALGLAKKVRAMQGWHIEKFG